MFDFAKRLYKNVAFKRRPVDFEVLIAKIRANNLSYCGRPKLENIVAANELIVANGVQGLYIEAGVALGGSAILLAKLKPRGSVLKLYDVFSIIPEPGKDDEQDVHDRYAVIASGESAGLGGEEYYGYQDGLKKKVKENIESFDIDLKAERVELIEGGFEDTLFVDGPVALAHIDCDWFESVRVCIERIAPKMAEGGIMIFDDYSSYSGCRKAVDNFLSSAKGFEILFHKRSLLVKRV